MKKIKTQSLYLSVLLFIVNISLLGCNKLVDAPAPLTSINNENAFKDDKTAAAVIAGIYARMTVNSINDGTELTAFASIYPSLMADELKLVDAYKGLDFGYYYRNDLSAEFQIKMPWADIYSNLILKSNDGIEHLKLADQLTPSLRNQLLGQCYFLRALGYFYLTGIYGDVPIVLSTDYRANMSIARSGQDEIYKQIIMDLEQARQLVAVQYLSVNGKSTSAERITPNRAAIAALLSRTYLYAGNFLKAEELATEVISQTGLYELVDIDKVFLANSREAIWQLQPTQADFNTQDAQLLVLQENGPDEAHPLIISEKLENSFEIDDQRADKWISKVTNGVDNYKYPSKYKNASFGNALTEYKMVLRLAEVFLIRAEARVYNADLTGAKEDLNAIRHRAGLGNSPALTAPELLNAIAKERRVELFTEWGDRWFNLKRTGTLNAVMSALGLEKGNPWRSFQQLLPIPLNDILRNKNLIQNQGY